MVGGEIDDSDDDGIGFVCGGWYNFQLMFLRSILQYVVYCLKENKLECLYSNYVDNVIGYEFKVWVLLEDVESLKVEFFVILNSSLLDEDDDIFWSESYKGLIFFCVVVVEFVSKDFGKICREFILIMGELL